MDTTNEALDIQIPPPESRHAEMVLVWRCTNCGEIFHLNHTTLPDKCPNCGADKTEFEQVVED